MNPFERKVPPGLTNVKRGHMILVKTEVIKEWLRCIGRNQAWLAKKIDITPGYMSLIINNECKVSREIIELLKEITHAEFETIFETRPEPDDRYFYGNRIWYDGKLMKRREYHKMIRNRAMLEKV